MKSIVTIILLIISNVFMTLAWYGHLRLKDFSWFSPISKSWLLLILFSWGIALLEYCFQVPANKIGFHENGGPFSLLQLKIMQEVITLVVFVVFSTLVFKNEAFRWNHFVGFFFLIVAVYFIFRK